MRMSTLELLSISELKCAVVFVICRDSTPGSRYKIVCIGGGATGCVIETFGVKEGAGASYIIGTEAGGGLLVILVNLCLISGEIKNTTCMIKYNTIAKPMIAVSALSIAFESISVFAKDDLFSPKLEL